MMKKMKWLIYALGIHSKYSVFYPIHQFSAQLDLPNFCKFQLHKAILDNLRVFESVYVIAGFMS